MNRRGGGGEERQEKKNGILVTNLINAVLDVIGATKETAERGAGRRGRGRGYRAEGRREDGKLGEEGEAGDCEDDEATIIAIGADR